jgi:hypothetical protein
VTLCLIASSVSGFSPGTAWAHQKDSSRRFVSPTYHSLDILSSGSVLEERNKSQLTPKDNEATAAQLFLRRPREEEYERRKREWAAQYTSVNALRQLFGANRNKLWGDLDAPTARRLYKTLLPRALLEMHKVGVKPEDLAPLAYQARLAAKLYARERSTVPARVAACTLDGLRQFQRYGKFQPAGMTFPQVWQKYETMILKELSESENAKNEDITAKICLKILERSCHTNEHVDRWILGNNHGEEPKRRHRHAMKQQEKDIDTVIQQLEQDVCHLLKPTTAKGRGEVELETSRVKTLRLLVRAKRRLDRLSNQKEGQNGGVGLNKKQ